ncbi:WhiB family transcriptional regulator [Streptomyces sp. NPDC059071]|uniref:WhiB family transcriptional regulator n=1 Tax=unclassified Streptomyces TaxID=2593676 RepID=UPI0036632830
MSTRGISTDHTEDWRHQADCRHLGILPEAFFPVGSSISALANTEEVKRFCRGCPVAEACALWALDQRVDDGVWGGLDEAQRRRILRHAAREELASPAYLRHAVRAEWRRDGGNPLVNVFLDGTAQDDSGHVRWLRGTTSNLTVAGRSYTPKQLAFVVGFGRRPVGIVRADCGQSSCVAPEHLSDEEMRMARDPYGLLKRDAARATAA